MIRRYQPDAIIVNNTGLDARGEVGNPEIDSVTFENGRPEPMQTLYFLLGAEISRIFISTLPFNCL